MVSPVRASNSKAQRQAPPSAAPQPRARLVALRSTTAPGEAGGTARTGFQPLSAERSEKLQGHLDGKWMENG